MRAIDRLLRHRPTAGGMSLAGKIRALFSSGEQGWWYDPSNFATLFQDAAGTTPVTAMEQPVGLQLDLSKGLVLGSEILTNGTFDSSIAGWTAGAGSAAWVAGTAQITGSSGVIARLYQGMTLTAGQWYRMTATCISTTDASATLEFLGGSVSTTFTAGQTKSLYFSPASTGTFYAQVRNTNAGAVVSSFDNISVQSLAGNHRFQSTSANRPVVSARVNLLTKTDTFYVTGSPWFASGFSTSSTANNLIPSTSSVAHTWGQTAPTTVGTALVAKCWIKPNGYNTAVLQLGGCTGTPTAFFNASTGVITGQTGSPAATMVLQSDGYYECTINGVASSTTPGLVSYVVALDNTTLVFAGDGTSGLLYQKADVRPTNQGVGLPVYQRVNTSTDYDSVGFPTYIKPNGSNQFMVANSINFSATDKMTVWQGVRKLSDAATGRVAEISVNAAVNAGAFAITAPEGAASNYGFFLRGDTGYPGYSATTFAAPVTNVLSVAYDISGAAIADEIKPRINGATPTLGISAAGPAGGGNFGTYPAYFYMRAGSSLPFNGNDYGSIARGAASTAAQITAGETYINSKTRAFA